MHNMKIFTSKTKHTYIPVVVTLTDIYCVFIYFADGLLSYVLKNIYWLVKLYSAIHNFLFREIKNRKEALDFRCFLQFCQLFLADFNNNSTVFRACRKISG